MNRAQRHKRTYYARLLTNRHKGWISKYIKVVVGRVISPRLPDDGKWLEMNGQVVGRSKYKALFDVLNAVPRN